MSTPSGARASSPLSPRNSGAAGVEIAGAAGGALAKRVPHRIWSEIPAASLLRWLTSGTGGDDQVNNQCGFRPRPNSLKRGRSVLEATTERFLHQLQPAVWQQLSVAGHDESAKLLQRLARCECLRADHSNRVIVEIEERELRQLRPLGYRLHTLPGDLVLTQVEAGEL